MTIHDEYNDVLFQAEIKLNYFGIFYVSLHIKAKLLTMKIITKKVNSRHIMYSDRL